MNFGHRNELRAFYEKKLADDAMQHVYSLQPSEAEE